VASSIETLGTELEVFPKNPNYANGISINVDVGTTPMLLHSFSAISTIEDYESKRITASAEYICFTKEESSNLLDFIDSHKGRRNKFWLYTKINEFTLNDSIAVSSPFITCTPNEYDKSYKTVDRIYMILLNGDIIVRRVTLVSVSNDDMVVSITPTMPAYEIYPYDVVELGRVICCRFDQSSFEFENITDQVYRMNLRFLELPEEYPAT